jgi:hypothetical protein
MKRLRPFVVYNESTFIISYVSVFYIFILFSYDPLVEIIPVVVCILEFFFLVYRFAGRSVWYCCISYCRSCGQILIADIDFCCFS